MSLAIKKCSCKKKENGNNLYGELDIYIESLHQKDGALINALHKAQDLFGYLSQETQIHIAEALNIPASKVYGVVTFYSYFSTQPKGTYKISVCMGTACFVRGADVVLKEFEKDLEIRTGEVTKDGMFSLDSLRCVGACGLAPVVMVNDKVYGRVSAEDVKNIIEEYLKKGDGKNDENEIMG